MFSKLPWSSHEEGHEGGKDEQSLTSVLDTAELRGELTLLIASSTESMRNTILDTFNADKIGSQSDSKEKLSGDEAIKNPNVDVGNVDVGAEDKKKKEREQREKEVSQQPMMELKEAALKNFDDWRDSVLTRVGEIVNSKAAAKSQKDEATPTSPKVESTTINKVEKHTKQKEALTKALLDLYPPIDNKLKDLEQEKRALVLHSLLLLLLSLEHYSAHSRILLLYMTTSLDLPLEFLMEDENKIAKGLLEAAAQQISADEETKKKAEENATSRKWKVGLASVAGAAIVGVTGGLAAPLLAAGVGSVMGGLGLGATAAAGYLGTLAGSSVIVGGLFGAYGGRMTGQMMDQYAKEVSDFGFVPIRDFHRPRKIQKEYRRLRVAIGISGWLTEKEEVVVPWRVIGTSIEGFALRWELEALMNLGNSITTMVKSAAWSYAKSEIIKHTIFASLMAGLWPLGLLKVSRVVDNPFSVARSRSEKAGEVLADALMNKAQGERPVTLIGYSLGARVIYSCLLKLAERKAFGLVESVVLLGAPVPSKSSEWRKIRSVVSGRVVNVYSNNDFVLAFLYRTSSVQLGVAGLQKVDWVQGVENVDVSKLVSGHLRYRYLVGSILESIGFEDIDEEEAERERAVMHEMEKKEEKQRKENEERQSGQDDEAEADKMQKEVDQKSKEGMMAWATEKLGISNAKERPSSKGETKAEA